MLTAQPVLTSRALLTAMHGMCFGGLAILTAFGLVTGMLMVLRAEAGSTALSLPASPAEKIYLVVTSALSWAAVLSGTLLVYPWYRATPPAGVADLHAFPRSLLLAVAATAPWHSIGMEWKEHVAFFAPVTTTAVAVIWWRYRSVLAGDRMLRATVVLFGAAGVGAGAVAALAGAFLNKLAPTY